MRIAMIMGIVMLMSMRRRRDGMHVGLAVVMVTFAEPGDRSDGSMPAAPR